MSVRDGEEFIVTPIQTNKYWRKDEQIPASSVVGEGDVVGPSSSTDNAIVRFDGTTGKLVQNSSVATLDDTGNISLSSGTTTPIYLGQAPSAGYGGLWVTTGTRSFSNYTIIVDTGGGAILNVPTGATFSFRINNGEILNLSSSGIILAGGATGLSGVSNLTVATLTTTGTGPVATKYLTDLGNNDGFIDTDVGSGRAWRYENRTASEIGFTFKGASGQSANLVEWTDNSDSVLGAITASGSLGVGEASPDYKLDVNGSFGFTPGTSVTPVDNGDVVIEATNNTTLTLKLKGSDGTVRTGTITLS